MSSPSRKNRTVAFAVVLNLMLMGFCGCYQQEKEEKRLRDWAESDAPNELRSLVRNDARARLAKAFSEGVAEMQDSVNEAARIMKETHSAVELPPDSRRDFRFWIDRLVNDLPRVDDWMGHLSDHTERLKRFSGICDEARLLPLPPPVDAAAVASSIGGGGYGIYIGVSMGGNGAAVSQGSYSNLLSSVVDNITRALSGTDYREEAKKLFVQAMPGEAERRAILLDECRSLTASIRSTAANLQYEIELTQSDLRAYSDQLIHEPGRALARVNAELRELADARARARLAKQLAADEKYRIPDRIVAYLEKIRFAIVRMSIAASENQCDDVRRTAATLPETITEMNKLQSKTFGPKQAYFTEQVLRIPVMFPHCFDENGTRGVRMGGIQ